jgi:hypothetical protein
MRHILLAATAVVMLSGAASAQNAGSNSRSTAINASGSASQATSNPIVNAGGGSSTSTAAANPRSTAIGNQSTVRSSSNGNRSNINISTYAGVDGSGNGGGSSGTGATDPSNTVNYSGGYTLRNVPEVIPPNVVGGNPCSVGASAGVSMAGFGIAGGATWADKQCERRQQAALLFNMGQERAAVELMCLDDSVRTVMRGIGRPCMLDPGAAQATAAAPASAPAVVSVATIPASEPAKPIRPEWCYTAGPAELRNHAECNVRS